MSDRMRHVVLRRVQLRDELKPVKNAVGGLRPSGADWLALAQVTGGTGHDSFHLAVLRSDGALLAWEEFDTFRIARAQAHVIVGVEYAEWEPCHIEITNDDGCISWKKVLPAGSYRGGGACRA